MADAPKSDAPKFKVKLEISAEGGTVPRSTIILISLLAVLAAIALVLYPLYHP
jgi:hypothetical protein